MEAEGAMTREEPDDMQWFRWWHDGTSDPKLLRLSYQHRWLWIAILTMASESPKRGSLYASQFMPCNLEDVARKAGLSPVVTKAGIDLMMRKEFGMLETDEKGALHVVNWDKRQFSSDSSTERVRRHRNRSDETLLKRFENVSETAPDTETDTEYITPLTPHGGKSESYPPDFEEFWKAYPRHVNKRGAFGKWKATLRKTNPPTPQQLIESARNYRDFCDKKGTTQDYILHAATFLGPQERWREFLNPVPEETAKASSVPRTYTDVPSEVAMLRKRLREEGELGPVQ